MITTKHKIWHYILIYCAVSFGGMALPIILGREFFVLFTFFVGLFICITKKDFIKSKFFLFIFILSLSLFGTFFASTLSIGSILSILGTFLFTYATIKYDTTFFLKRLLTILIIISTSSIILFSLTKILGIETFSPIFQYLCKGGSELDAKGVYSYGGFIYRWVFIHSERNCGPFGEPGQYQGVLSVALYFSLYKKELFKSINEQITHITIFTITLLTTLSTNGYIALSIIYIGYLIHPYGNKEIKKYTISLFLVVIILLFITPLGKDFIKIAIYDKFYTDDKFSIYSNTTGARTNGIVEIYNYIQTHPSVLLGIGYDKLESLDFDTVSGLPKLFIAIGIFPFTILIIGIIYFSKYSCKTFGEYFIRIMLFISMGFGQPHIMNPCLFFMIFYDYIKIPLLKNENNSRNKPINQYNNSYLQ